MFKQASFRWVALVAATLVTAIAWLPAAMAQRSPVAATAGDRIGDIRIEGIQRIEPETVRSYLILQPGDPWDSERIDRSLKALFATGLFADVKLTRQGNSLVVSVVENPIINRIAFEGNSKIADKDLNGEIQLRPRTVYTRTRVQNDVDRILQLYRRRGQLDEAVVAFEAAEHWETANMGPKHPYVVAAIIARAATLAQMGRAEEACRQYSRALHLIKETVGSDHPKAREIEGYLNINCG